MFMLLSPGHFLFPEHVTKEVTYCEKKAFIITSSNGANVDRCTWLLVPLES